MEIYTIILLAEAAFAVALAKRKDERLAEAAVFLIVSILLVSVDLSELASRIGGTPVQLFSVASARTIGLKLIRWAEETLAAAIKWSYNLSILNCIALAAVLILTMVKGVVIAAFLVQNGIHALQNVANAYLTVSMVYRFVGQLFLVLAEAAARFRPLLPFAGLLMIPKATRKLGASLLTLALIMSFVMPALVNLWSLALTQPRNASEDLVEVGTLHVVGVVQAPVAGIDDENVSVWEEVYPMPPGGAVTYMSRDGREVTRLIGQWYLEKSSAYKLKGVTYAGFWLPAEKIVFELGSGVKSKIFCTNVSESILSCWFKSDDLTQIVFKVGTEGRSTVLFYDDSGAAKGWGYWVAKGFFVLKGSEKLGSSKPWYNVSGFLGSHQLVAILHPNYCEVREGNETIRVRVKSKEVVNVTVRYTEVTAWIEGHFDPVDVCKDGVPRVLHRGLSRLRVNEEIVDMEPILSCEVSLVEPSLEDAREAEAKWFDHWARLINASLPPFSNYSGLRICIYGRGAAEAIELNGSVFYSRSLWQRRTVPRAIVRARYFGDLVKPAIIGPVKTGLQPSNASVVLPLLKGDPKCPAQLELSISDRMDERAVTGLFYDSDLEPVINGSIDRLLKSSVADVLGHTSQLALFAVSMLSVAFATIYVASLLGGFATPPNFILRPFYSTFYSLEQLGRSIFSLAKEIFTSIVSRYKIYSIREPSTLMAFDLAAEIRKSIEQLREGLSHRHRGLKGAVRKIVGAWQTYSCMHPIPALLRAASEVALKAAVSRVKLNVPYVEKLRLALRDPMARRLIVASDVLYATSLLLDSRLGTLGPALRYVKRFARGYRLTHPREMSEKDLRKIRRPKRELEKALAAVARDILRGRDPSRNLTRVERVVELYPQLSSDFKHYFGERPTGSTEELARRIVSLAAAKGFTRKELFELLEKYPEVGLFVADRTAIEHTVVRGDWKAAVAAALSKLSKEGGTVADLGAVWLSSYERGELWRYLIIRTAWEIAQGREPWFLSKLHPEVKRVLIETAHAIASKSMSVDFEAALKGEELDDQANRFVHGYLDALKDDRSASLSGVIEAFILSGDAYWAGWAAALAQRQGGAEALAQEIADSQLKWFGPRAEESQLIRNVASFLERAYRELANAIINLEEKLRLLEGYWTAPSPGMSLALAIAEQAEIRKLASRLQDLYQSLNSSLTTLNALLAECSELKREVNAKGFYGPRQCIDALRQWQELATRALKEFYEIKELVEDELRRLGG